MQGAISSLSITVATGIGIGYPLTGIIAATLDYRYAFWFAGLFVISAMVVVLVVVPRGPDEQGLRVPFDTVGAVLLGVGLAALLLGISEGPNWGWTSVSTIATIVGAVVVLALWVVRETSTAHPLIRLDLLRKSDVLLANVTALSLGASMYIGLSVISLIAQAPTETTYGVGLPLFWAGFVMLPLSLGSQTSSRLAKVLVRRVPFTLLLPIGAVFVTVANLMLLGAHDELWELLVGTFFFGVGIGTTYAAMPGLIARGVAAQELGSAVSFNQVLRTVGGSLGSAVAGAVLATHMGTDLLPTGRGIDMTFLVSGLACAAVALGLISHAVVSARLARRRAQARHPGVNASRDEVVEGIEELEPHETVR
ncbi:hypothetical protein GCM10025865_10760 [Paraoerskovia sediminicola]|uniref:Major facilitator superfamily (MFS) profile domain-containing protein n=1 Tax=Paraoerskovia sediminicola TaxID=1138587 RepID=A0ABN6XDP2_9CELL|nr:MFS transporter [Paraoerskovia sediminicola]BDZ41777.1 hypothetical protein GCM10025865_10760 [Paraoerskovia sediminicola]